MRVTFKGFNSKVVLHKVDVLTPAYALIVNGTVVDMFETRQDGMKAFNKVITHLS
jgi:hypothetical protein